MSIYFYYFPIISPFGRAWPFIWTNLVWLKLAQWFWRRRWKREKFTDRLTDRQTTDDRWSEKLTWAFSSGELKKNTLRVIHRENVLSFKFDSLNLYVFPIASYFVMFNLYNMKGQFLAQEYIWMFITWLSFVIECSIFFCEF